MKNLQLILTNPCTKQWSDIERPDGMHYCDRCEKNIVDLTHKSDKELIQFFKHKNENVCGRLLASQLNRNLVLPPTKINWNWLMPLALGALVINPAQAQQLKPALVQDGWQNKPALPATEFSDSLPPLNITFTGTVVDELSGKGLVGVKVKRMGEENVVAITDSTGRFSLNIADGDTLSKFVFKLQGYSNVETYLNNNMVVKLFVERRIMLGGITTISPNSEPLYLVLAGRKSCTIEASKISEISPDWIEKIEILKGAASTALYGSKAANGVIMIEIKKAYRKKIRFSK